MTGTRLGRHFADVVPAWHVSANITTPRDVGTLLFAIERASREGLDTVASYASCRAMIQTLLGQEDKSKIPSGLPPGTPCANKTGEIDGVRNDAAIVDPFGDTPFILVVFNARARRHVRRQPRNRRNSPPHQSNNPPRSNLTAATKKH